MMEDGVPRNREHLLPLRRLRQVVVSSQLHRGHHRLHPLVTRQHDHRHGGMPLPESRKRLKASQARHLQIEIDRIRHQARHRLKAGFPARERLDFVSPPGQDRGHQTAHFLHVVDHQHKPTLGGGGISLRMTFTRRTGGYQRQSHFGSGCSDLGLLVGVLSE
jgi:hypothetical protein